MKIGVCILAYGEEHINECINLLNQLSSYDLNLYITTDSPILFSEFKNINIIHTTEPFNYNLKRLGITAALIENDCVIQLDTDIYIKGSFDFKILDDIKDGMYVRFRRVVNNEMILSSKEEWDYINKIKDITNLNELFFIDESTLIFKISSKSKKESLIKWWDELYTKTIELQPIYKNKGAVEGLLIYSGCILSDITIFDGLYPIIDNMYHYLKFAKLNLNKTVI